MKSIGIIPVRMESTRLPQKPLRMICGLPMIHHVIKRAQMCGSLADLYVATDSEKIAELSDQAGCKFIMTKPSHKTGTDRVCEAIQHIQADIIVNIQGDEALLRPEHIDASIECLIDNKDIGVAMLGVKFEKLNSPSDIKIVLNKSQEIMYFSRNDIPANPTTEKYSMLKAYHLVSFRRNMLEKFASWERTPLEKIEVVEYLRILEKGHKIACKIVDSSAISVDTLEDLKTVSKLMKRDNLINLYKHTL